MNKPYFDISCLDFNTGHSIKKDSMLYRMKYSEAETIKSIIEIAIDKVDNSSSKALMPGNDNGSILNSIEKLADMKERGLIDEEEFKKLKEKIMYLP